MLRDPLDRRGCAAAGSAGRTNSQSSAWDQEMSAVAFLPVHLALSADGSRLPRWQCLTRRGPVCAARATPAARRSSATSDRCRGARREHRAPLVSHDTASIRDAVGETRPATPPPCASPKGSVLTRHVRSWPPRPAPPHYPPSRSPGRVVAPSNGGCDRAEGASQRTMGHPPPLTVRGIAGSETKRLEGRNVLKGRNVSKGVL